MNPRPMGVDSFIFSGIGKPASNQEYDNEQGETRCKDFDPEPN